MYRKKHSLNNHIMTWLIFVILVNDFIETGSAFWLPDNKDAKKRYDREFLLSLQHKKSSTVFPEVLSNFDFVIADSHVRKRNIFYFCLHMI